MWLCYACISVWELQNSKHFNSVQKSSRYLECYKSYDGFHPGTKVQNSSRIPVGVQGFVGFPPHPGCMMIYSNCQMCPALNSTKPYWSNKQVVSLLGCCSNAPGSPRKLSSDMWESNLLPTQFWVRNRARIWLEKIAAHLQHFVA